jgi:hypothetical protein
MAAVITHDRPPDQALGQPGREESMAQRLVNAWSTRLALAVLQTLFYEDAARIRLGDYFRMDGRRADVQGYQAGPYMRFWNVWLDRK